MLYDLTKHAIIENNGDLIAIFSQSIPSNRAFEILDDLNNAKSLLETAQEAEGWKDEYENLKKDLEISEKEFWKLEEEHQKLDDRLQSIITMLEHSSDDYSKEELIKEVIDICSAPL